MWFHLCKIVYIVLCVCMCVCVHENVSKNQIVNGTDLLVENYGVVFTFHFLFIYCLNFCMKIYHRCYINERWMTSVYRPVCLFLYYRLKLVSSKIHQYQTQILTHSVVWKIAQAIIKKKKKFVNHLSLSALHTLGNLTVQLLLIVNREQCGYKLLWPLGAFWPRDSLQCRWKISSRCVKSLSDSPSPPPEVLLWSSYSRWGSSCLWSHAVKDSPFTTLSKCCPAKFAVCCYFPWSYILHWWAMSPQIHWTSYNRHL